VEALLEATIQVLLHVGKERLTTTKVADRAGVSVGTLYQYFPNKSALLQAALRRHLSGVAGAVERTCKEQAGAPHRQMVDALITTFLRAKMADVKTSVTLHSVSSDVDGAKIAREIGTRLHRAIVRMLASSPDPLRADPELAAFMLQSAMVGVGRSLVESAAPAHRFESVRRELITLSCAYLGATMLVAPHALRSSVL
jgi:AcrR family transcriptional regulator